MARSSVAAATSFWLIRRGCVRVVYVEVDVDALAGLLA
jgi:hypothetical protein